MFRRSFTVFSMVSMLGFPALASGVELTDQEFDVSIRDQNVRDVFEEISAAIDIPILVSDAVSGRVSVSFEQASAKDMLDGLAREGALDWRVDGNRIRVTARSEQMTRIVDLDGVTLSELSKALKTLGVYNSGFPMTAVDGEFGMLIAPPDYIAVVEVVLGALTQRHAEAEAARLETERKRNDNRVRAAEQRLELERLGRAADLERMRLEHERLLQADQQRDLRAIRAPKLIRNGVWGG